MSSVETHRSSTSAKIAVLLAALVLFGSYQIVRTLSFLVGAEAVQAKIIEITPENYRTAGRLFRTNRDRTLFHAMVEFRTRSGAFQIARTELGWARGFNRTPDSIGAQVNGSMILHSRKENPSNVKRMDFKAFGFWILATLTLTLCLWARLFRPEFNETHPWFERVALFLTAAFCAVYL